ncbi:MAG: substrate-binding periplasmic protein [Rhodoferax sp.]|jgi:polar amino acid transport system substrate-binding protein
MQHIRRALLGTCIGLALAGNGAIGRAADYKLSTLEWAPYTGANLPRQGSISANITESLKMTGYSAEILFFPWTRAIKLVDTDPSYIGFFPAHYSRERAANYLYSDPVGTSTVVFLQRTAQPLRWTQYSDLAGKRIGVVRGFVNTEALDAMISTKAVIAEESADDRANILKLVSERVDAAVVDMQIYEHLVQTDPQIAQAAARLQFNAKPLEVKNLYVCFKRSAAGEIALRALNTGLRKLRPLP